MPRGTGPTGPRNGQCPKHLPNPQVALLIQGHADTPSTRNRTVVMSKLLAFIGAFAGGWLGWWLGALVGFMTAFVVSILGTAAGVYFGRRIARQYLE
jgi:hypothetical protein